MIGSIDDAFRLVRRYLDQLASRGMVVISWGELWSREMQPFRRDPRFPEIVARMRFADYWMQHGSPDGYQIRNGVLVEV
jgi:hypothetical protein